MTAEEIKKACDSINEKLAGNLSDNEKMKLLDEQFNFTEKLRKIK